MYNVLGLLPVMPETRTITAESAAATLGVTRATLYAYVSRGLLRRIKDRDQRRSMYLQEDVDRLKARRPGQPAGVTRPCRGTCGQPSPSRRRASSSKAAARAPDSPTPASWCRAR